MSNGFQQLGFSQPVPGQVLRQKHHYMGSQFFWPGLCEEQPVILCIQGRLVARLCPSLGGSPQWLHHIPCRPLTLGTCQASDQMLTRVPQETGAAQGRFQPLTAIDGRLMWGGRLWRETGPSLLLEGTQEWSIRRKAWEGEG